MNVTDILLLEGAHNIIDAIAVSRKPMPHLIKKGVGSSFIDIYLHYNKLTNTNREEKIKKILKDIKGIDTKKPIIYKSYKNIESLNKARADLKKYLNDTLEYDKKVSKHKKQEEIIEKEYAKKSSVKDPEIQLSADERSMRFSGKINALIKSSIGGNTNFFINYLSSGKEVNFFKSDVKLETKKKDYPSKGEKKISKNISHIEVKLEDPSKKFKFGEILSIRSESQWIQYRDGLMAELKKKGMAKNVSNTDKIASIYFTKLVTALDKAPDSEKNKIINRVFTHAGRTHSNSFISIGKGKHNQVTVPFNKKYVRLTLEKGNLMRPSSKIKYQIPRIIVKFQVIKKFEGNVTEALKAFKSEMLND